MRYGWLVLLAVGCSGDAEGTGDPLVLSVLNGQWTGTALATTELSYDFAATFLYDETVDPALGGEASIDSYLFDVLHATSDSEWADLELLNPQGRAHLVLSGVGVDEPNMTGHFEMDVCWATDPNATNPECHAEGNFAATRQ